LPKDNGILRTALQQNEGNVGVYAKVVQGGQIKRGDRLKVLD
jgi:MOSC domain-containing protein YiiM